MLNYIWLGLILLAVIVGGLTGHIREVVDGAVNGAGTAVSLALGLVGVMAMWLGLMRLAEKAGLIQSVARGLRPILRWLFPDVPAEHPALGSMVMNIAANMLGLNNAATPLGLRAMKDLESLNRTPGAATNAMCTFLAINTGSVQLIPMTAVAILAAAKSQNPTAIIGTALLASICSTSAGIMAAKLFQRLRIFQPPPVSASAADVSAQPPVSATPALESEPTQVKPLAPMPTWGWLALLLFTAIFGWVFVTLTFPQFLTTASLPAAEAHSMPVRAVNALSLLAIPFLVAFFPLYAALRRIPVYEEFVEGAKEGFQVALRIIPFLVAMLVAIFMFRGSGGIDLLTQMLKPALDIVRLPPELMPLALMRPLSGSASLGIFTELVKQHGPDSLLARTAGTLFGSTETTFYVIAVYFGAVGVRKTRHAVPAGLVADTAGIIASVLICRIVFG